MAKNFGPGILGSVVLIDPATGLPYKAEGGGGGGGGAFNYVGDWDSETEYKIGQVVSADTWDSGVGQLYVALTDNVESSPLFDGQTDWLALSGADAVMRPTADFGQILVRNDVLSDPENPELLSAYFSWLSGFVLVGWQDYVGAQYRTGFVVQDPDNTSLYVCINSYELSEPIYTPAEDDTNWRKLTNQGGGGGSVNAVRSDATDTYAYMGTAPSGTDPATGDWNITRISLTDPNNPKHAVGPWADRTTLYA